MREVFLWAPSTERILPEAADFANPGIFGLKGGVAVTTGISIEETPDIQHPAFRDNPLSHRVHGVLWEGGGTFNMYRVRSPTCIRSSAWVLVRLR